MDANLDGPGSEEEEEDEEETEDQLEDHNQPQSAKYRRLRRLLYQKTLLVGGAEEEGEIPETIGKIYNHIDQNGIIAAFKEADKAGVGLATDGNHLVDVGSGYGATILLAATIYPELRCTGIEWFKERVIAGEEIKEMLVSEFGQYLNNCKMFQGDFVKSQGQQLMGATHVWAYDVAYYPEKTSRPLLEKLGKSKKTKNTMVIPGTGHYQ